MSAALTMLIVDTDVVSFIFKGDSRGPSYEAQLSGKLAYMSFQTVAELEQWAIRRGWGARKHADLLAFITSRFAVIESSPQLCRKWAEVREQVRNAGRLVQPADAWIGAMAELYSVPLMTNNASDYQGITGLTIISDSTP